MLNVVQRVGGSLGTAVLAVVLERQLAEAGNRPAAVANGFGHTYWWAMGFTAIAMVPALVLARAQRSRPASAPAAVPTVG
jgi:hypothetical protein